VVGGGRVEIGERGGGRGEENWGCEGVEGKKGGKGGVGSKQ